MRHTLTEKLFVRRRFSNTGYIFMIVFHLKSYGLQCCAWPTDGPGFEPWPQPPLRNVCKYVDQKGSAAMLTSTQSATVTPEVNLRIT